MLGLFAEGLETAFFPCTLVVAVPALAVAMGGRRSSVAGTAAFIAGLTISAWLRFSGVTGVWSAAVTGIALILGGVLLIQPRITASTATPLAGLFAGGAAGSLWRPCVGFDLGELLTGMTSASAGGLLQLSIYVIAVLAPVIALSAVLFALPSDLTERAAKPLSWIGGGTLVLLGLAVLAGLDDRVITRLFELSSFG